MYITLPSNASHDIFPENTPGSYKINLPYPVELNGKWEVGLSEIQYTKSWYNITKGYKFSIMKKQKASNPPPSRQPAEENLNLFEIRHSSDDDDDNPLFVPDIVGESQTIEQESFELELQAGYYKSIQDICRILNENIKNEAQTKDVYFELNTNNQKVTLHIKNDQLAVIMSKELLDLLGFRITDDSPTETFNKSKKSFYVADLKQGMNGLYVYCDIVEPHIVGNTRVPLLRILPVEPGEIITKTYTNIQYYPVLNKRFNSVEIQIKDDTNNVIVFQRGKTIVTLHFKKVD